MINKVKDTINGKVSGATSFFRNRPLFTNIINLIKIQNKLEYRILFHSCSVGAEVYSFAIELLLSGIENFYIDATDYESKYLDKAILGEYYFEDISHLTENEKSFFNQVGDKYKVDPRLKSKITFLPTSDYREFTPNTQYDVVFILNSLCYINEREQSSVLQKVRTYNLDILVISGFHIRTIKNDIINSGYKPFLDDIEIIHNSWPFRIIPKQNKIKKIIKNIIGYHNKRVNTGIEPFAKIKDYNYKYCSIFRKI